MYNYYQKPVIILVDDYDVPMAKGDLNGYYREITGIMRLILSKALKDNSYLKFAILTGCLRIAKESIFTGFKRETVFKYGIAFFGKDCLVKKASLN